MSETAPLPRNAVENESRPASASKSGRGLRIDFLNPPGDPGLTGPGSVSWRIFNAPLANAVGGIAAVILELSEPSVRAGVWDHSTFRTDPIRRMQNTGMAAMAVTYGPSKAAEMTFQRVTRMHERVEGTNHEGRPYRAMDPDLLTWVHVTAAWSFLNAYIRYVEPDMSLADQNRYYAEGESKGKGFGAQWVPTNVRDVEIYMEKMRRRLYPNGTVQEFLKIVGEATPMGRIARPLQRMIAQAAIDLLAPEMQQACGVRVTHPLGVALRPTMRQLVRAGNLAQRFDKNSPAAQACHRMGVSTDCLYS